MGQPLAHELGRGTRGNREVPPHLWRRGLVGETGFPPRERAEGERRSRTPSDLDRDLLVCGLALGDRHRHGQEAALVLGARVRRIDLLGELNPPLERSMLDLHVEEAAAPGGRARAGNDERLVVGLLVGGFAFTHLSSLLSNEFSVPGTDSERARTILERHFGDRSDGAFTVVFRLRDGVDRAAYVRLQRDVDHAARVVPDSTPRRLVPAGRNILYGDIVSTLSLAKAKGLTDCPD